MDTEPDKIIEHASKKYKRTEDEKFSNHFLDNETVIF